MWPFVVSRPAAATYSSYSASDTGAEYCDECVCVSMSVCGCGCVCVCLRSCLRTTRPIFTKFLGMLPMTVAGSFSGGVVIYFLFCGGRHKPRLLDVTAQLKRSPHAALGLAINCVH